MKNRTELLTGLICLFSIAALPAAALAQEEEAAGDGNSVAVDKRSLSELRREVYQAEEDFYAVYNRLNEDRDYDVRCFYEQPTGTRVKNHVCRARFVTKAFERHAARNRNDISRIANQDSDPVLAEKTAIFQTKLETLITENAELQAALVRYNTLLTQFAAKREADTGN